MSQPSKLTIGQAIDKIVEALQGLDENARSTVLSAVCAHLGIKAPFMSSAPDVAPTAVIPQASTNNGPTGSGLAPDIRSLKNQKQPKSARQMACLVAYYLQDLAPANERKASVSANELEKYFKQAGFQLPGSMNDVLTGGKRDGYFETTDRGEYRLTSVGYNLAAHNLPSAPKVK